MTYQGQQDPAKLNKGERKNIVTAAKGGGIGFIGKLFVHVISLGFVYIMTRTFGAEQYGLYRLAILIAGITAALSLIGLDGGLKRFIAIARSEENRPKLWGIIQLGIGVPIVFGLLLSMSLALFAEPISIYIFGKPQLTRILRLVSIATPFLVLIFSLKAIAIGFKRIEYNVYAHDIAFNVLKILFSTIVILLGFQIEIVVIAFIAAAIFSVALLLYFLNKSFPFRKLPPHAERHNKEILLYSFPLFLSLLLNQFGRNFESLVLGSFGILADVGVYSVILTLSNVGNMGFVALRSISNPIFAELHHKKKFAELKSYYQTINRWSLSFNFPIFLVITIFPENILTIFGEDFTVGVTALIILAFGTLFNAATGACGALLNMSGYSKLNFYNSMVYLATTLVLDFVLIPKYGLLGAAVAGGLTFVIINTLMMAEVYLLIDKILPFNKTLFKPIFAAAVAGSAAYFVKDLILVHHPIPQLLVVGLVMLLLYIAILRTLKFSQEDQFILRKLTKRNKRKTKNR